MLEEAIVVVSAPIDFASLSVTNEALLLHSEVPILLLLIARFLLVKEHTNNQTVVDHDVEKSEIEVCKLSPLNLQEFVWKI